MKSKKKKIVIIISLILIISFAYALYPVLDCKKLDRQVTGNAIYESQDIERVSNLSQVNIDTIGISMNPVITENMQCTCIKKEIYEKGNVVFFFQEIEGQTMGITHRIIYINETENLIITKGDNNIYPDLPIRQEAIQCYITKVARFVTWF